ncbi:PAS domain S-box protein, partial [Caldimonas sp. KR1-144]|uniref:sensor domain-containing protein n=1 Tax=Caldimonas sp. KR1-144 TaxID=3400911 RepID=UPI003C1159CB
MSAPPASPDADPARLREFEAWCERLPGALIAVAADGRLLAAGQGLSELSGWPRGSLLGTGWRERIAPASRSEWQAALAAPGARGPAGLRLDLQYTRADGGIGWLDCAVRWDAQLGAFVCSMHDITARKVAELAARLKAAQFQVLADNVPALIAYYELEDHRCQFANRRYASNFGWDEQSIVGRTAHEIVGERGWQQIKPFIDEVVRERHVVSYERELTGPDGQHQWIEVEVLPHLAPQDGELLGAFVRVTDITKHRLAERAVRESEERLQKFMQASAEGIVFHRDGLVLDVNPPLAALIGYTRDELLGRRTTEFVAPEAIEQVMSTIASEGDRNYESAVIHRNGTRIPVELLTRGITIDGERLRFVIVRDIRDRIAAQARIHHLAHHDALTGLPNRLAFVEQLEQLAASHRADDAAMALLFIDLDHFKRVNDSLGHLAGDTLLQTVASRITGCLRASDRVARFGGDEFMVLLTGASDRSVVEQVAHK